MSRRAHGDIFRDTDSVSYQTAEDQLSMSYTFHYKKEELEMNEGVGRARIEGERWRETHANVEPGVQRVGVVTQETGQTLNDAKPHPWLAARTSPRVLRTAPRPDQSNRAGPDQTRQFQTCHFNLLTCCVACLQIETASMSVFTTRRN
ncbi:unnamed protein product [Leuciscus chuanchicus]